MEKYIKAMNSSCITNIHKKNNEYLNCLHGNYVQLCATSCANLIAIAIQLQGRDIILRLHADKNI